MVLVAITVHTYPCTCKGIVIFILHRSGYRKHMWRVRLRKPRRSKMMFESSHAVQLTFALSAGLGCGILIGALLVSRRRTSSSTTTAVKENILDFGLVSGEYKMVFVVRNDLKMGKGKVAAQCGHAAIGAYKQIVKTNPELLRRWESAGSMKVVVKAPDEQAFLKAVSDASSLGLNTHIVRDAGRTQIAPGSKTVLCIGPGSAEHIDIATGDLKLY